MTRFAKSLRQRLLPRTAALALASLALAATQAASSAQEIDRVQTRTGNIPGRITQLAPNEVTVEGSSGARKVSVREITSIMFGGEPIELTQARLNANNHQNQRALDNLAKIDLAGVRRAEIRQDIEFYTAYCQANLALGGGGSVRDAGALMFAFVQQHPNSHHFYQAQESLAGLLVEAGNFAQAQRYYGELAKAPWEDYQLRARRLIGQTQLAQEQYPQAIGAFDQVLGSQASDADSEHQKMLARVGKAISLAETGRAPEAVGMLQSIVQEVDETELEYFALAYNALGRCHRKAGQPQDAILAYLHVDILCAQLPGPHAEALAQLVPLWREIGDAARSAETLSRLRELYPDSRWAKQEVR